MHGKCTVMPLNDYLGVYPWTRLGRGLFIAWIIHHTYKGPPWNWKTPVWKIYRWVNEFVKRDAEVALVSDRWGILCCGIAYRIEEAGEYLPLLTEAGAPGENALYIESISTLPRGRSNGFMKDCFQAFLERAQSTGKSAIVSWTSESNYQHLKGYFDRTGREAVGSFTPPRFHEKGIALVRRL